MQPDPIATLDDYAHTADLTAAPGAAEARAAIWKADAAYVREVKDLNANWNRLEVGAGADRLHKANKALDEALDTALHIGTASLTAAVRELEDQALPQPPRRSDELSLLRNEFQMLTSTGNLVTTLTNVASGPRRDLAALLQTPWFDSLATTHGGIRPEVRAALRTAVLGATEKYGTDAEKRAMTKAKELKKAGINALTASAAAARARKSRLNRTRTNLQARADQLEASA